MNQIPLRQYWPLLGTYLRPQLPSVVALGAMILLGIGLQLVNPQILREFINTAMDQSDPDRLPFLALWFIGITFAHQIVSVGITYLGENISWKATNALRYDLAQHCLHLDMSFHNDHTPGEMIERARWNLPNSPKG